MADKDQVESDAQLARALSMNLREPKLVRCGEIVLKPMDNLDKAETAFATSRKRTRTNAFSGGKSTTVECEDDPPVSKRRRVSMEKDVADNASKLQTSKETGNKALRARNKNAYAATKDFGTGPQTKTSVGPRSKTSAISKSKGPPSEGKGKAVVKRKTRPPLVRTATSMTSISATRASSKPKTSAVSGVFGSNEVEHSEISEASGCESKPEDSGDAVDNNSKKAATVLPATHSEVVPEFGTPSDAPGARIRGSIASVNRRERLSRGSRGARIAHIPASNAREIGSATIAPTNRPRRDPHPIRRYGYTSRTPPSENSRPHDVVIDDVYESEFEQASPSQCRDNNQSRIVKLKLAPPNIAGYTKVSASTTRRISAAARLETHLADALAKKSTPSERKPAARTPRPTAVKDVRLGVVTPANSPHAMRAELDILKSSDPTILEISRKLTHRFDLADKPEPRGQPEVWADSRQALCETVPYFKMPQSGCHQNERHVYAFLFDNVGHPREYMDADIIIARAGGSMEPDSTGKMVQKKNHLMSESQVRAVMNDIEHQNPVVIICGNKNAGAPCQIPHRYCVLGWYKPISVWAEKTLGKSNKAWTTIKYRFERLGAAKNPAWHAPIDGALTTQEIATVMQTRLHTNICSQCEVRYPQVYLVGWMCLNPECTMFWKLSSGNDAAYDMLHYNPTFLLDRTPWQNEDEPYSVKPKVPDVGNVIGDNLSYINTRGICCPECGRCSSRRLFKGWKCDNPDCSYENFPAHIPVKPLAMHNPWDNTGDGPALSRNKHERSKGIRLSVDYVQGFKIFRYTFDGIQGSFVHAVSNAKINRTPGGADEMFAALQDQRDPAMDLHLERRRFGNEKASNASNLQEMANSASVPAEPASQPLVPEPGLEPEDDDEDDEAPKRKQTLLEDGDFMTAFSMNYGMPYKFVASGASLPFRNAPWPVRACRADLNYASQTFLDKDGHTDLNEELIFAYLEGQKIEYHDDGEEGLGPRIATLSLGGKAKMHMRMKRKHYVGCSKQGVLTAEKPVPGSIDGTEMYAKRLTAWHELQELKQRDRLAYEKRRKAIPRELGLFEKRNKKAADLVTVTLNHGDIVLMEGYEIQQYLEHKVVPEGCLRFALTCRTVLANHLTQAELPSYGVEADEEDMSGLRRRAVSADANANADKGKEMEMEKEKEKETDGEDVSERAIGEV